MFSGVAHARRSTGRCLLKAPSSQCTGTGKFGAMRHPEPRPNGGHRRPPSTVRMRPPSPSRTPGSSTTWTSRGRSWPDWPSTNARCARSRPGSRALRDPTRSSQLIVEEARRLHRLRRGSPRAHGRGPQATSGRGSSAAGVDDATGRWMLDLEFPLHGGLNGLAAALGGPSARMTTSSTRASPTRRRTSTSPHRLGIRGVARSRCGRRPARSWAPWRSPSGRSRERVDDEASGSSRCSGDQAAVAVSNARLDALLRRVGNRGTGTSSRTRRTSSGRSTRRPGSRSSPTPASG